MNLVIFDVVAYLVVVLVCVAALRPRSAFNRAICRVGVLFGRLGERRAVAMSVLFIWVIAARLAVLPFLGVPSPGIHDEFSYLLQADTFLHGRLANPTTPLWKSFETFHVNFFPTYSSMYPPVQGAFLAIGTVLGHAWAGVLLGAALMSMLVYWSLCQWIPSRWAFLAGALAALKLCLATYWVNGFWGGAAAAIGGALVLGAYGRLRKRVAVRDGLLLAAGVSILANSRPFEGALFCLPFAVLMVYWLAGKSNTLGSRNSSPRERIRKVLWPVSAVLLANFVFMGYYNWRLTGKVHEFPEVLNSRNYDIGAIFLWQKPQPPRKYNNDQFDDFYNNWERTLYQRTWPSFVEVMKVKLQRLRMTFAWWGLLGALPGALYVFRRRNLRPAILSFLCVSSGALLITWSYPHYFAPATVVIYLGIAMAIRGTFHWKPNGIPVGPLLARLALLTLLVDVSTNIFTGVADGPEWGGQRLPSRAAIEEKLGATPGEHLVMVRYSAEHSSHEEWVYNGADLERGKVLWARELDEVQNRQLLGHYKDRKIWLVNADEEFPELLPYGSSPGR